MNKLIIDTSTYYLFVSVIKDDKVHYNKVLYGKNNHSENLMNIVSEGLKDVDVKSLNEVIVGIGPGSYTGVRIALTVAKTLAWTLNIPLKTISSLTLVGSGYLNEDGVYGISCIAKKGHVYGKIIEVKGRNVNILLNDIFLTEDEFKEKVNSFNALYICEGEYKFDENIINSLKEDVVNVHEVVPNYLRKANS